MDTLPVKESSNHANNNQREDIELLECTERVTKKLRQQFGEATYKSWLRHLLPVEVKHSHILFAVPTRFIKQWIMNHYLDGVLKAWQKEFPSLMDMDIVVRQSAAPANMAGPASSEPASVVSSGATPLVSDYASTGVSIDSVESLGSPLDQRFLFTSFVVGDSNKLAYSAAKAIAQEESLSSIRNPLFIHGGVGLGKTHLMQAIAWEIKSKQPQRKVVYLSAEKFMYQFISALRNKVIMSFKEKFRCVDVLLLDDIQFICGKESTLEEFHHTFNALLDQNKHLIISGDRSPSELEGIHERLRSRLGWGLVADINNTSQNLREGILRSKLKDINVVNVPDEVVSFLAGKITSNVRELEGALNKVIAHATLMNHDVTIETTQKVLSDLLRANEKTLTIMDIQRKVADYFDIKIADMSSSRRSRSIARPRQIAMYLSKNLTTRSLSEIGRKFGGKDHTTVIHAIKKVEELQKADTEFSGDLDRLTKALLQ